MLHLEQVFAKCGAGCEIKCFQLIRLLVEVDIKIERSIGRSAPDPFKPGELMDIAAKPATTKVKVRPLKNLKGMV